MDFLELRACDESCAGGVLISGNRFLTVERMKGRAMEASEAHHTPGTGNHFDKNLFTLDRIQPRSMLALDADRSVAMEKMNRLEDLLKVLPGIDCGACGSPTCRALAEDIVQDRALLAYCIFLQEMYIRDKRLSLEEADEINGSVWGRERKYRSQRK